MPGIIDLTLVSIYFLLILFKYLRQFLVFMEMLLVFCWAYFFSLRRQIKQKTIVPVCKFSVQKAFSLPLRMRTHTTRYVNIDFCIENPKVVAAM